MPPRRDVGSGIAMDLHLTSPRINVIKTIWSCSHVFFTHFLLWKTLRCKKKNGGRTFFLGRQSNTCLSHQSKFRINKTYKILQIVDCPLRIVILYPQNRWVLTVQWVGACCLLLPMLYIHISVCVIRSPKVPKRGCFNHHTSIWFPYP